MDISHDQNKKWKLLFAFLKDQGLSIFSLCLVLLLAAGAFALSYAGLKDLASTHGVDPGLVWIWPLVLDGAIIVFSVCAFRAGLCGESVAYPMFLVVLSTMASIAFNVLHAPIPPDAPFWSREVMIPRIMASIPPLALFLSFEVMIRQLQSQVGQSRNGNVGSGHHSVHQASGPLDFSAIGGGVEEPTGELVAAKASKKSEPRQKVVVEEEEEEKKPKKKKSGRPSAKDTAAAKALVIEMCKEGALLEEMAEASGRSTRTVSRYLSEAGLVVPMAATARVKKKKMEEKVEKSA